MRSRFLYYFLGEFHFHKWQDMEVDHGLAQRGVVKRRGCTICEAQQIKKAIGMGFRGGWVFNGHSRKSLLECS
jgi:hypothetical protein